MSRWRGGETAEDGDEVLVSHTGVRLSRHCAFKFALDPNRSQDNLLQSFINEMNAWKNGLATDSPVDPDTGDRGVVWRDAVSTDVFECASVDAATALKNCKEFSDGTRAGEPVGFPDFRAKHHETPRFRLRSRSKPGQTSPIRVVGAKKLRLGKLGEMRIHGCTSRPWKMIAKGRFHIPSASFSRRAAGGCRYKGSPPSSTTCAGPTTPEVVCGGGSHRPGWTGV